MSSASFSPSASAGPANCALSTAGPRQNASAGRQAGGTRSARAEASSVVACSLPSVSRPPSATVPEATTCTPRTVASSLRSVTRPTPEAGVPPAGGTLPCGTATGGGCTGGCAGAGTGTGACKAASSNSDRIISPRNRATDARRRRSTSKPRPGAPCFVCGPASQGSRSSVDSSRDAAIAGPLPVAPTPVFAAAASRDRGQSRSSPFIAAPSSDPSIRSRASNPGSATAWARKSVLTSTPAGNPGSSRRPAPSSQRRTSRSRGAASRTLPSKRGRAGSVRCTIPSRLRSASPGSRTAKRCSTTCPCMSSIAAEKSRISPPPNATASAFSCSPTVSPPPPALPVPRRPSRVTQGSGSSRGVDRLASRCRSGASHRVALPFSVVAPFAPARSRLRSSKRARSPAAFTEAANLNAPALNAPALNAPAAGAPPDGPITCARSGPATSMCPVSPPSAANWPTKPPETPARGGSASILRLSPDAPSAPAAVSRAEKRTGRPPIRPLPTEIRPPASVVSSVASIWSSTSPPTCSRPFSIRAENALSQYGGQSASSPCRSGQSTDRSGPLSASSRASTRPASSGSGATRSRNAFTVSAGAPRTSPEVPPATTTSAAVSSVSGRSDSVIGPAMVTGRPSVTLASDSIVPR